MSSEALSNPVVGRRVRKLVAEFPALAAAYQAAASGSPEIDDLQLLLDAASHALAGADYLGTAYYEWDAVVSELFGWICEIEA